MYARETVLAKSRCLVQALSAAGTQKLICVRQDTRRQVEKSYNCWRQSQAIVVTIHRIQPFHQPSPQQCYPHHCRQKALQRIQHVCLLPYQVCRLRSHHLNRQLCHIQQMLHPFLLRFHQRYLQHPHQQCRRRYHRLYLPR